MVRFRAFLLALALAPASLAATAEWTGASGVNWSDPGNWVGGRVPVAGDDLVFPAGRPTSATNDLPAGTEFRSMVLATNVPERYTINGNAIRLGAGGLSLSGAYNGYDETHTLNLPIALAADQTWTLNPVRAAALTVNGAVDIGAFTLTVVYLGGLYGPVRFRGAVTGTGRIIIGRTFTWFYEPTNFAGSIVTEGLSTRFIGTTLGAAHVLQTGGQLHMTRAPTLGALVAAGGEWGGSGNTGDLTLESGSEMRAGAGTESGSFGRRFETVRVTGRVRIEGATLSLLATGGVAVDMDDGGTPPAVVAPGEEFVIIDNDGSDPVEGTFAPWEGTVWHGLDLTHSLPADVNVDYTVRYDGGDGNDVAVRAVPAGAVTTTVLTIAQPAGSVAVLTATVTGGTAPPGGIVRFMQYFDPVVDVPTRVELGTAVVDAAGVATLSLPRANGRYYAIYRGDPTHRPSGSQLVDAFAHGAEIPALGTGALLALIAALAAAGILAYRT